jgi:hypothetical protein
MKGMAMRASTTTLALALFFSASLTMAGELYGTITDGDRPVGSGVKVEITAAGKAYAGETNKFGAYRLFVKEKGKCTLTVQMKSGTATAELFSYDKSTRYDWICETQDGKPQLRRK